MRYLIVLSALALLGCGKPVSSEEAYISFVQEQVRERLREPSSAVFRDVGGDRDSNTACGEVNARNGYGGMTGFEYFVYENGRVRLDGDPGITAAFQKCAAIQTRKALARRDAAEKATAEIRSRSTGR